MLLMTYRRTICTILSAILLILAGTGIYYFFRSPIRVFSMFDIAPRGYIVSTATNPWLYWLIYCLPDALWYMSLLLVQNLFWKEKGWLNRLLIGLAISLPFLLEAGQYFGMLAGTFDRNDIITYCFTLILFLCLRRTSLLSLHK